MFNVMTVQANSLFERLFPPQSASIAGLLLHELKSHMLELLRNRPTSLLGIHWFQISGEMKMTQAINFNELKNAFAPVVPTADVHGFNGKKVREESSTTVDRTSIKKNQQLMDQVATLKEQQESLELAYNKSLRHVNTMMQEKMDSDSDFQRLHEDKIRMVRAINVKQHDIEDLRKTINSHESTNRALKIKMSHSKHSVAKLTEKNAEQAAEMKSMMSLMRRMSNEIEELKQSNTIAFKLKEKARALIQFVETYLGDLKARFFPKKLKLRQVEWTAVSKRLPDVQGMVFVRNDVESDLAVFNPQTRKFKCANKAIKINEWAPAN
jgi:hypothetical protein